TSVPPPMRTSAPATDIPKALEEIVARLLEKRPEARFASAEDVVAALENCATELAIGTSQAQVRTATVVPGEAPPKAACAPTVLQAPGPRAPMRRLAAIIAWGRPRLHELVASARASYAWLWEKTPPRARPVLPWGLGAAAVLLVFGPVLLVVLSGTKHRE